MTTLHSGANMQMTLSSELISNEYLVMPATAVQKQALVIKDKVCVFQCIRVLNYNMNYLLVNNRGTAGVRSDSHSVETRASRRCHSCHCQQGTDVVLMSLVTEVTW